MHMVCSGKEEKKSTIVVVCTEGFRANPKRRGCHRHDVVQVSAGILEVYQSQIPHSQED